MEMGFSMWSVPRCHNREVCNLVGSVRESVKTGLELGGRRIATAGAITRKRPVTDCSSEL
jgi:hypothetical protein